MEVHNVHRDREMKEREDNRSMRKWFLKDFFLEREIILVRKKLRGKDQGHVYTAKMQYRTVLNNIMYIHTFL